MKIPPNGQKTLTDRYRAGNKWFIPVLAFIYILAFYRATDLIIKCILGLVLSFFVYIAFHRLRSYRGELHGRALRKFNKLYVELFACGSAKDLVGAVHVIESLAEVMETDFYTTYNHLTYNSFIFGDMPTDTDAFTFLLEHSHTFEGVWEILCMDKELLPQVLASPQDHLRRAAIERIARLQKRDEDEGTLDLP